MRGQTRRAAALLAATLALVGCTDQRAGPVTTVEPGRTFGHEGFLVHDGWGLTEPDDRGVPGLVGDVTNLRTERAGQRVRVVFRDGSDELAVFRCSSGVLAAGETARWQCDHVTGADPAGEFTAVEVRGWE